MEIKIKESPQTMQQQNSRQQFIKMTQQPVSRLLLSLSIPTIISMMVTNIYNMIDTAFVSRLGTSASGATGIVFGFMAILQAFGFLCGQGAGSIMSRNLGAKRIDEAIRYTTTGFFLSFFLGLLIAMFSLIFLEPLIYLLGSTETIAEYAKDYMIFIIFSAPFFTTSFTMNNLLRYEGRAKLGTIGMMTGAIINIAGDALFIFVFHMGIKGAGLSTALSQLISFGILLSMYLTGKTQTKIAFSSLAKDFHTYANIIATGFPSLLRQSLNSIAAMLLNNCANIYGDAAVAAMSIVSRVSFFPMAIAIGIGQGFQPISSFNYGAKKFDRVRRAFWSAFWGSEVALFLISIPIFLFASTLIAFFRNDSLVIIYGERALQLMCIGQLFVPLTMMVEMGFQSTGQKLLASFTSTPRSGFLFIPILLILSRLRGMNGIQEAQPLAFVFTFMICLFLCKIYLNKIKAK